MMPVQLVGTIAQQFDSDPNCWVRAVGQLVFVFAKHRMRLRHIGSTWRTNTADLPHRFGITATAQNPLLNN
jgi:hypothetical protein